MFYVDVGIYVDVEIYDAVCLCRPLKCYATNNRTMCHDERLAVKLRARQNVMGKPLDYSIWGLVRLV